MKQVAGYGGMCRQSSTLKADERDRGMGEPAPLKASKTDAPSG